MRLFCDGNMFTYSISNYFLLTVAQVVADKMVQICFNECIVDFKDKNNGDSGLH